MTAFALPPSVRLALVGAGRVGTAVASLLQRSGHDVVAVWSRSDASAERARLTLGAPVRDLADAASRAQVVLVGVTQDALEEVAQEVAGAIAQGAVVCHFAGAVGIAVLHPVLAVGGGACALHPVAAIHDLDAAARRLSGCAWGITCSDGLDDWAAELVARDLQGVPVAVSERDRPLWHAAAVTTANGIAALLSTGEAMLGALDVASPREVLGPLARGVLANAHEATSAAHAVTGPVVRGEIETIRSHLDALGERAPALVKPYVAAAWNVLLVADREGRIEASTSDELRGALEARWK